MKDYTQAYLDDFTRRTPLPRNVCQMVLDYASTEAEADAIVQIGIAHNDVHGVVRALRELKKRSEALADKGAV